MDLSLSLFLFSYGDNKDQEEEEDYFDSGCKKNLKRIEKAQYHLTLVSEPRLSTSLGPPEETGLSLLRPKARCVRGRLLGYPTSVLEGVGDEFISVRESLIS